MKRDPTAASGSPMVLPAWGFHLSPLNLLGTVSLAVEGVYLSSIPKGEVDTKAQLWHPIPSHKHLHHLPPQLTLQFPPYLSFILNPRVTKLVSKVNLNYITVDTRDFHV